MTSRMNQPVGPRVPGRLDPRFPLALGLEFYLYMGSKWSKTLINGTKNHYYSPILAPL